MSLLRSRTRKLLSDDPAIDIEHFEANVAILDPGRHRVAIVEHKGVRHLPCAVIDAR